MMNKVCYNLPYLFAIFLASCGSRVQVFEFSSFLGKTEDSCFYYTNDTIEVKYSFSAENGVFGFQIVNLTNYPIFIDWSKSSFIYNNVKNDYWRDSWKAVSMNSTWNPLFSGGVHVGYKEERITFIPPNSIYQRTQFQILNGIKLKNSLQNVSTIVVPRNDNNRKKTKVQKIVFNTSDSPINLRNYLTYALSEDFTNIKNIDHQFNLTKVQEMDVRHFEHYLLDSTKFGKWYIRDQSGNPIKISEFRSPTSFYVYVNKGNSIR